MKTIFLAVEPSKVDISNGRRATFFIFILLAFMAWMIYEMYYATMINDGIGFIVFYGCFAVHLCNFIAIYHGYRKITIWRLLQQHAKAQVGIDFARNQHKKRN